jgi:hypothetical protein
LFTLYNVTELITLVKFITFITMVSISNAEETKINFSGEGNNYHGKKGKYKKVFVSNLYMRYEYVFNVVYDCKNIVFIFYWRSPIQAFYNTQVFLRHYKYIIKFRQLHFAFSLDKIDYVTICSVFLNSIFRK